MPVLGAPDRVSPLSFYVDTLECVGTRADAHFLAATPIHYALSWCGLSACCSPCKFVPSTPQQVREETCVRRIHAVSVSSLKLCIICTAFIHAAVHCVEKLPSLAYKSWFFPFCCLACSLVCSHELFAACLMVLGVLTSSFRIVLSRFRQLHRFFAFRPHQDPRIFHMMD